VGHASLRERFPRFFQISTQESSFVRSLCSWVGGKWAWDLRWRRRLFVLEVNLLEEFLEVLEGHPHSEGHDFRSWKYSADMIYSIKTAYGHLSDVHLGAGSRAASLSHILALVWKSWASSKVLVFSWQLLLDRIPTMMNLLRRGVLRDQEASLCVFCGVEAEIVSHLFVTCWVALRVWYDIFRWFGWELVLPMDLLGLFEGCCVFPRRESIRCGFLLIWHSVVWSIWSARNDLVFSGRILDVEQLVDKIQFTSLHWFFGSLSGHPCSHYEWMAEPSICWDC